MRRAQVDTSAMRPIEELPGSDVEFLDEVTELAGRAQAYLGGMSWCDEIISGWLANSWGYILGVFYFHISPARPEVPHYVWVIVGDMPPAYLSTRYCTNWFEAINGYVVEMQEWVDRVLGGREIDESVIPVNVPPTRKWARELRSRLNFLKTHILDYGPDQEAGKPSDGNSCG